MKAVATATPRLRTHGSEGNWLRMSYGTAMAAAIVFFTVSIFLLGLWPGRVLDNQISAMTPDNVYALSASETRGRAIYAREGCAYCHTQQIRYIAADMDRFGAPTLAWEGQFDKPHMWGTRRVGPDLSRAGGTRSLDWQYAHLFDPRSIVPWSIMPAYAAFFDGAANRPKQEARDLVAYLESLGRARALAWPAGEDKARSGFPDDPWVQMALAGDLNRHPGSTRKTPWPPLAEPASRETGLQVWLAQCTGCHGFTGLGDGPGGAALQPSPANLAVHEYSTDRLAEVLWNGVTGTAMPAWRDLSRDVLAALAVTVQGLHRAEAEPEVTPEQLVLGESVYRDNCVQCHGSDGGGAGFAADRLPVQPTDFRRVRPDIGESVRVLNNGIDGTPMAPWTDRLDQDDILAVTHYLRRFYGGTP